MRLLTKFSLASIAALAIVVTLVSIVGIRVFDSISHQNHVQILELQVAAVAHDLNTVEIMANDAPIAEIMRGNEIELGARLFAYRNNAERIYPPAKQTLELPESAIAALLESDEGSRWVETSDARYLVAWRLERSDNLLFGALLPETVVYADRAQYLSGIAGAALVVLLVGAIASVLAGRSFSGRVSRTLDALDKMRRGEFGTRIAGVRGHDELSNLQRQINAMADMIARRARDSEMATRWLQESESRFRDFAEATVDAFWETDAELCYTWFSNQGLAFPDNPENNPMLGKKRGAYFENIKASEGDWAGHLNDLENRRTFRNFQFSGVLANGAVFHRVSSGTPFFDDAGNFAGYRGTTSDVTDRVETERRLSNLISNIPGLVFQRLIHPDERIEYTYLSGDTGAFFGSTNFETLNDAARDMSFVHPEDRERLKTAFIEGARSGRPSSIEFRHLLPDGEVIWIQLNNAAATRRPDGVFVQDGFSVNVTNLKNAEHAARISQDRLLGFMSAASDTLWETDSEHRITWLSDPDNLSVRHLDKSEMIGRRRWEFPSVEMTDGLNWQRHQECLEDRRPIRDFEFEVQIEEGRSVFRRVSGNPIFDDDGNFIGYRGVSTDITERIMAEREARTAERRLTSAIQTTDQGVALFDADDRLVFVNDAYRALQPLYSDLFVAGRHFKEIMNELARLGRPSATEEELGIWLEERLSYHQNPTGPFATVILNDRHIEIRDERLPDGGSMLRLTDVSTQVLAQHALKDSEERFRDFAEASSDWLWEMDADFRFLWHSADADPAETPGPSAVGKTPWEYLGIDVDQDANFQGHIDDLLARRAFRDFRYAKILRGGNIGHRSTSGIPHFTPDGAFLGYRGTTTDITEQVEAEQRYRNLIEQTPAPVIVHSKEVIKFANSAALAMFGADR